jgi:septum formation protein
VGAVETSVVRFRRLTDDERESFLVSRRWEGKAGAYGVQDRDPFVAVVRGSFSNVVGLPMERLARLLRENPGLTS